MKSRQPIEADAAESPGGREPTPEEGAALLARLTRIEARLADFERVLKRQTKGYATHSGRSREAEPPPGSAAEVAAIERAALGTEERLRRSEAAFNLLDKRLRRLEIHLTTLEEQTTKAAKSAKRLRMLEQQGHLTRWRDLESLFLLACREVAPIRQPLVLISQATRSGGTLLSQLFDAHPQVYAHPYELYTGYPRKDRWPELRTEDGPDDWWEILRERPVEEHARYGYAKDGGTRYRFFFMASLQRELFLLDLLDRRPLGTRQIMDAYFTSYFHAWLDYRNHSGEKRVLTAFVPRLSSHAESVEGFFATYPDGTLISLVRDPDTWLASKLAWLDTERPGFRVEDPLELLAEWEESARAMVRNRAAYGSRVILLRYEDLVQSTEAVMRFLAGRLGLSSSDGLLRPTFNGEPIGPNSWAARNEGAVPGEIDTSPLTRDRLLDDATRRNVSVRTRELMEAVTPLLDNMSG